MVGTVLVGDKQDEIRFFAQAHTRGKIVSLKSGKFRGESTHLASHDASSIRRAAARPQL
jgi:hypothetical protein